MKNSTNILSKYLSILIYLTVLIPSNLLGNDNIQLKCKTKTFQTEIPTKNIMYPVTDIDLPNAFNQLIKPKKILSLNPNLIHTSKKNWVDEWLNSQ